MISRKSKIIGQYPYYQYVQSYLKEYYLIILYNYLISNNLITTNQSGIQTRRLNNQLAIYLTYIIHSSFDLNMSREVRYVFLDMSKA